MAIKYFLKELVNNPVLDSKGKPIVFEAFGGETGLLALDDTNPDQKALIGELNKLVGRLGIIVITQAKHEEVKKKTDWKTFAHHSPEILRPVRPLKVDTDTGSIQFQRPRPVQNDAAAAAKANPIGAPPTILPPGVASGETPPPASGFKPRTGKASKAAKAAAPEPVQPPVTA